MATYFHDESLATGSDDGSSWEDAFQDITDLVTAIRTGGPHTAYSKTHSGITLSAEIIIDVHGTVWHGGCDADLTGTATSPRTGITVLDGGGSVSNGLYPQDSCTLSRFQCDDFTNRAISVRYVGTGDTVDLSYMTGSNSYYGIYIRGNAADTQVNVKNCNALTSNLNVYLRTATVKIENCLISGNGGGSGLFYAAGYEVHSTIEETIITNTDNGIEYNGTDSYSNVIRNSLIYNNVKSSNYPAFDILGTGWRMVGCTITENESTGNDYGGGYCAGYVDNCIIYGNSGDTNEQVDGCTITYSDIEDKDSGGIGTSVTEGTGCVDADPQFLGTGDDPYQLTASTPTSVSEGASTGVTSYVDWDYLDEDRDNSTPSMGAYEYISSGWTNITKLNGGDIGPTNNLDGYGLSSATKINGGSV